MKKCVNRKSRAKKYAAVVDNVVIYPKPVHERATMCMEQLSTVCGVCSHMSITDVKNKRGGVPCTYATCKDGHWTGSHNWNRLCYV